MKPLSILAISVFFFLAGGLSSQNVLSNPSFESVSGTPSFNFFEGEVINWFANGEQSNVPGEFYCPFDVQHFAADGTRFALLSAEFHAIVNELAEPVFPGQKLSIQFKAKMPACTDPGKVVHFYLSNTAVNTTTPFNPTTPPLALRLVTSYSWQNFTANNPNGSPNIIVPTVPNGPCSYKYLIVLFQEVFMEGPADGSSSIEPDHLMLDDIRVEACASDLDVSVTAVNDQEGMCNDVLFTASTSGGTGLRFFWTFGDGNTQCTTTPTVTYSYDYPGDYNAILSILDDEGCVVKINDISVHASCERCEGMQAGFSIACTNCYPHYVVDPKTGKATLAGYTCFFNLTDQSIASPNGQIVSWEWSWNGTVFSTSQNPSNVGLSGGIPSTSPTQTTSGKVCLTVVDNKGCKTTYCEEVDLPCRDAYGKAAPETHSVDFQVNPNPNTGGLVQLSWPESLQEQPLEIQVFDLQGRMVGQSAIEAFQPGAELDLGNLENGVYIISLRHKEGISTRKVVVQR
jgi:hypothetical protein